jgi:hypothetical protein
MLRRVMMAVVVPWSRLIAVSLSSLKLLTVQ